MTISNRISLDELRHMAVGDIAAMPAEQLQALGKSMGLEGAAYPHVKAAWDSALQAANPEDRLYIGGSTFVVADALMARR